MENWADVEEIKQLKEEFRNRFKRRLTGLLLMQQLKQELEEQHYNRKSLEQTGVRYGRRIYGRRPGKHGETECRGQGSHCCIPASLTGPGLIQYER